MSKREYDKMAEKFLEASSKKIGAARCGETQSAGSRQIVLVGTHKEKQLAWIKQNGIYNYPVKDGDEFDEEAFGKIKKAISKGDKNATELTIFNPHYKQGVNEWLLSA